MEAMKIINPIKATLLPSFFCIKYFTKRKNEKKKLVIVKISYKNTIFRNTPVGDSIKNNRQNPEIIVRSFR